MPRFSRGVIRSAVIVAYVALVQPFATLNLADPTKDFPLCIQACNDARKACDNKCKDDCDILFPGGGAAFNACVASCKAICNTQSDDCKRICQEIRDGGTPPQP